MKIGFISDKSAPFTLGGYELRIFELARLLALKHDVTVFTSFVGDPRSIDGVHFVNPFPSVGLNREPGERSVLHGLLYSASLLRPLPRVLSLDAVVVQAIPYLQLWPLGTWLPEGVRRVVVDVCEAWSSYNYRDNYYGRAITAMARRALISGARWATKVTAISNITAQSLINNLKVDPNKISVIPMGLRGQPTSPSRGSVPGSKVYDFITVGRLVRAKRHADLLRALAKMKRDSRWSGRAVIVGDGPERRALEELARDLGLMESVAFVGAVDDTRRDALLRDSLTFVLTSEREGFSQAALEAMASGLPVAAAEPREWEVFGVSDFLRTGENGWVFPVGDIGALSKLLQTVSQSQSLTEELGRCAARSVSQLTWERSAAALSSILES